MITRLSIYKKVITLATALTVTTACSALENENAALLVEKHAEFILKNKAKIESHFEVVIKVLESEKYKEPILRFVEERNAPIKDFVLVKALNHFEQSPLDLVLDAPKALNLPRTALTGNGDKLQSFYVIPFDPSYIGALTTGYQLSPSAVEKATEAVEFLIPLYSILLDTLLEFDEFDQPKVFRYASGAPQIHDGFAGKWLFLGRDKRLNDEIPLKAFFPILMALNPANHGRIYAPTDNLLSYDDQRRRGANQFKHLNISQLKLLEKVYDFINSYNFYWFPGYNSHYGEKIVSSIQVAIEKSESEVVDFSDLGADGEGSSKGAEESSGLDFSDLEL